MSNEIIIEVETPPEVNVGIAYPDDVNIEIDGITVLTSPFKEDDFSELIDHILKFG